MDQPHGSFVCLWAGDLEHGSGLGFRVSLFRVTLNGVSKDVAAFGIPYIDI